jgi:hypothetical protein
LFLLIGINGFSQALTQKSTSQLVNDLKSNNRDLSDSAIDELSKLRIADVEAKQRLAEAEAAKSRKKK